VKSLRQTHWIHSSDTHKPTSAASIIIAACIILYKYVFCAFIYACKLPLLIVMTTSITLYIIRRTDTYLSRYRSCHALCPAPLKPRLPYSYLAKSRPQRGCLPVTSSPPDSALTRLVHCLACTYRVRALSGGDDVTARQPDCGRDFAS